MNFISSILFSSTIGVLFFFVFYRKYKTFSHCCWWRWNDCIVLFQIITIFTWLKLWSQIYYFYVLHWAQPTSRRNNIKREKTQFVRYNNITSELMSSRVWPAKDIVSLLPIDKNTRFIKLSWWWSWRQERKKNTKRSRNYLWMSLVMKDILFLSITMKYQFYVIRYNNKVKFPIVFEHDKNPNFTRTWISKSL